MPKITARFTNIINCRSKLNLCLNINIISNPAIKKVIWAFLITKTNIYVNVLPLKYRTIMLKPLETGNL